MFRIAITLLLCPLLVATVEAQGGCCGYGMGMPAGAPPVKLEGHIVRIRIAPGEGMPAIVVKTDREELTVLLGPLRYLMAQNFNPKVGEEVAVKAYETPRGWIAAALTLKQTRRELRLRDGEGRPLWRGGRWQ